MADGYRTDLDLRRLFSQLPRADDGSDIELPNRVQDTVQPVVELFPSGSSIPINDLTLERVTVNTVAPTQTTGTITVPNSERWIIWRAILSHSEPSVFRNITVRYQQPGVASALLAVQTGAATALNEQYVYSRPTVLQPLGVADGFSALTILAGSFGLNLLITRFTLLDTLPQVPIGF